MNHHTFIIETAHEPGELARVAGVFAGRGLNIERLNVEPLSDRRFAQIRVLSAVSESTLRQVTKQLQKLVRVRSVEVQRNSREIPIAEYNWPASESLES